MDMLKERMQNEPVNASDLLVELDKSSSWQDAYWIGKCLYNLSDSKYDLNTLEAFEKAFDFGLNIYSAQTEFFDATQITAKLYFNYGAYELAINKLMLLADNNEIVPDWVHLYYASAQIHTENLFRIAEDPTFFFARLDRINSDIEQEVVRRNSIYKEFLTLLINKLEDGAISTVAGKAIIEKAINFQLNESLELHKFRDSFGIDIAIPKLLKAAEPAVFYSQVDVENNEEQPRQIEQLENERLQLLDLTTEQNSKIAELENTKLSIEKLIQENNRIKHELQEKNRLIDHLREEVKALPRLKPSDINAHKLLQRNQKLLVIGGTKVKERDLRGVAKDNSGFKNEDIVFVLEYDKIKSFTSRIVPWNSTYSGIVVGPCPHNTGGSGDYSSFIQKIKEEKGYPHVEEMRESSGQLKMTKQSFREALDRMVNHLQSIS